MTAIKRDQEPELDMRYFFRWVLDGLDELYSAIDGGDFQSLGTGAYLLKGESSRLNVQKLFTLLGHVLKACEGAGELGMETEISDRFAFAACKCEEVFCEMSAARAILKPILGNDQVLETGNGSEMLVFPPLAFNKALRNQIAILAGPEGKAYPSESGLRRGLAGGLKALHKFHMKMFEGDFSLDHFGAKEKLTAYAREKLTTP